MGRTGSRLLNEILGFGPDVEFTDVLCVGGVGLCTAGECFPSFEILIFLLELDKRGSVFGLELALGGRSILPDDERDKRASPRVVFTSSFSVSFFSGRISKELAGANVDSRLFKPSDVDFVGFELLAGKLYRFEAIEVSNIAAGWSVSNTHSRI